MNLTNLLLQEATFSDRKDKVEILTENSSLVYQMTFHISTVNNQIENFQEHTRNVSGDDDPFFGRPVYTVLVPSIWFLLVFLGSLGNGLVIYTLSKNGDMTASNCYIINLAVADLTFLLIVVPSTAASYSNPDWLFGDFICRITTYMIYVSICNTSFKF